MRQELAKVVIGQEQVIEQLLAAIFDTRTLPAGRRPRPGQNIDG